MRASINLLLIREYVLSRIPDIGWRHRNKLTFRAISA